MKRKSTEKLRSKQSFVILFSKKNFLFGTNLLFYFIKY